MILTHGTRGGYVEGCHCRPCMAAAAAYSDARRKGPHGSPERYDRGCRCMWCRLEQAYRETDPCYHQGPGASVVA